MTAQTSVIIPCYNHEATLGEALESVRAQTRAVREIILVDDGSKMPVRLPSGWEGPPLRIIRTENRGAAAARNLGVSVASGNFIAFLDADDSWASTKIELQEDVLTSDEHNVAVFTQRTEKPGWVSCVPISYPLADASEDKLWVSLWKEHFIVLSSVMVRRDIFLKLGGFNESLRYCEDRELWFRLLRAGHFIQVPLPLCYRRMHPNQMTKNFDQITVYRRKCRLLVMLQHGERLAATGISRAQQLEQAWKEYREDLLILYFKRQFSSVRRLFWGYLLRHPSDIQVLKYAFFSLLPTKLFVSMRDRIELPHGPDAQTGLPKE